MSITDLIADLEYLQRCEYQYIVGGAYTYADAVANASKDSAVADASAVAKGDYVAVKTKTSVESSEGKYLTYNRAFASASSIARTGYEYSISADYDYDLKISPTS